MGILDVKFVQGFIRMCNDGWEQGWHERNGGNLSWRMKPRFILSVNMKSIVSREKNNKSLPALSLCRIINNNSDKEVDKENGKLSKPGCNQIYRSSRFGYIGRQNRSFGIHQFCTLYVALRLPKVHFWKIYILTIYEITINLILFIFWKNIVCILYFHLTKCFSYKIKKELPQNFKIIPFSSFSKIKVKK